MAVDVDATHRPADPTALRSARRLVTLLLLAATLALLAAAYDLGTWLNRWYLAGQFLEPVADDVPSYADVVAQYGAATDAVRNALVNLAIAVGLAWPGLALRRRLNRAA